MKGTVLVAIVAIVIILVATFVFIFIGLPNNTGVTATSSIISAPPQTASLPYIISFAYASNPITAGQIQTIVIEIVQGGYQVSSVPGTLQVNSPSQVGYQIFSFTTDAGGEASFTFPVAQNATIGTYHIFAIIESLQEVIQNTSSTFVVVS